MNLRETQLSSRAVIPVALALPINRDQAQRENPAPEREVEFYIVEDEKQSRKRVVCFYL